MMIEALALIISGLLPLCDVTGTAASVFISSDQSANRLSLTFHPEKLRGICIDLYELKTDHSNLEEYAYAWEHKIYDAAGVDFKNDTAASAREKIQRFWLEYGDLLVCDSDNFSVPGGSILKYAIEMRAYNLLSDAIQIWQVDLNRIDRGDGKTLLDFAELKLSQNHGTELEPTLLGFIIELKRAGAKHASELLKR